MKVEISEQVLTQVIEDELVLLNMETGRYFGLNPSAYQVWQLVEKLRDSEAVIQELGTLYDAEEGLLRRDVDDLLARLVEARLIAVGEC